MTVVANAPFWEDAPEAYGTLVLGTHTLLGIRDVQIKRSRKRDAKSAPGANGAKLGNQGFEAATVKITWMIHRDEGPVAGVRWQQAAAILADLEDKKRAESGLSITHPFAAMRGVQAVVIDDIEGPSPAGEGGLFSISLSCTEHTSDADAKKGGKTAGGAGGGLGGESFEATVSTMDAKGKATGDPRKATVVEPQDHVFREVKSGKRVLVLHAHTEDGLTPRERDAKERREREAAGLAPMGTFTDLPDPPAVGGEVGFVESPDGEQVPTDERFRAITGELDP